MSGAGATRWPRRSMTTFGDGMAGEGAGGAGGGGDGRRRRAVTGAGGGRGSGRRARSDRESLVHTGSDWLVNVLANCRKDMRDRVIMLIWRIWSLRSELAHGKDVPSPNVSADFLQSYLRSLDLSRRYSTNDILHG